MRCLAGKAALRCGDLNHLLGVRPYWVLMLVEKVLCGGELLDRCAGLPILLGHEVRGHREGKFFGQCRHEGKGVGKRVGSDHRTGLRSWPDQIEPSSFFRAARMLRNLRRIALCIEGSSLGPVGSDPLTQLNGTPRDRFGVA